MQLKRGLTFNVRKGKKRPAFTLIEVLIAGGVLFIVSAAIVGLSNSIISGTAHNADQTVANRWASEGLELTTKVRDDTVLKGNQQNGEPLWFGPAFDASQYGWYILSPNGQSFQLQKAVGAGAVLNFSDFPSTGAESLTSQSLQANRLICVEAVGALTLQTATSISCNTDANGNQILSDGDRANVTVCDPKDVYCTESQPSLNRNELTGSTQAIIPPGNAVKVRAVVVWPDKANFGISNMAMMLTNWKGPEQNQ